MLIITISYDCLQVSVQQSIGTMIQDFPHIAVEAKRRLLDILTDEFEKLRRFVTLFNMPMSELEVRRTIYFTSITIYHHLPTLCLLRLSCAIISTITRRRKLSCSGPEQAQGLMLLLLHNFIVVVPHPLHNMNCVSYSL